MVNAKAKSKSIRSAEKNTNTDSSRLVDVLYQRMGDRWYAFSLVDDEVFFSPVDQDLIDQKSARPDPDRNGINRKGNA